MMNLDQILQHHLAPIVDRREKIHNRKRLTVVFSVMALLGWYAWSATSSETSPTLTWLLLPILGGLLTALLLKLTFKPKPLNLREVARDIEADRDL